VETSNEVRGASGADERPRRVIKRYSNRKLYDTRDSRYVTLQQIGEMVRAGEEVQIIDNKTKEDKTEVTLALILSEDLKSQPRSVPLAALRDLIQERGGRLLSQLREGPIGRFIPGSDEEGGGSEGAIAPGDEFAGVPIKEAETADDKRVDDRPSRGRLSEIVESSKHTLDAWQASVDERVRAILPSVLAGQSSQAKLHTEIQALQAEVERLTRRVDELESKKHTH